MRGFMLRTVPVVLRTVRIVLRTVQVVALLAIGLTSVARIAPAQETRNESQLAEDQSLLKRQLSRLRQTMEVLAKRFEDEGRAHAATLLRDGLKELDARPEQLGAKTIDELMTAAQENLESGRSVQSVEAQEAAVKSLERLYSILTDRRGLEDLQKSLDGVKEIRRELNKLASQESQLRDETKALRERAVTPEQKELRAALQRATAAQRSLLERTEAEARESSDLDLAALERELEALLADQKTDAAVLSAWKPEERAALESAARAAEQAASPAARAERLAQAASELRQAAQKARTAGSDLTEAQREVERAGEREDRHARASSDAAAERAAQALAKGAEALREAAAGRASRPDTAAKLEAEARALEAEARAEEATAQAARAAADAELAKLADPKTAAGASAKAAREALAAARPAAKPAGSESNAQPGAEPTPESAREAAAAASEAQRATLEAARELQRGLDDMRRVAPLLAESQREAAERAERIARGLRDLPGEGAAEREKAASEADSAAQAQRAAAEAAKGEQPSQAASSAAEAQAALERAQSALQSARAAQAKAAQQSGAASARAQASQALQQEQEKLAQETEALREAAQKAGLEPEAQRAAEEAIQSAAESMRSASAQIGKSQTAEASGAQSQALEKLQEAQRAAESAGEPRTPEEKSEAERLKKEQERIRAELLKLAERNRQREGAKPSPAMEGASRSAQKAQDELADGDLSEAEQAESDAERQMREAEKDLAEEEEQYQRLRQEELLFKIAEQVKTLTEEHQAQMRAVVEIDSTRKPGDKPSHTARLRLRKVGKAEEQLGARATEIGKSIREEQSLVFAEVLDQAARDLASVGRDMTEPGDWQSGDRVQALQQDVEQSLAWLTEALAQEKQRRQQQQQQQQPPPNQQQAQNRLVPDVAELKLLRRMGVDVTEEIERLRILHPEIEEGGEVDRLLLQDVARLGFRHERVSDLFQQFRARLGIADPGEENP